MLSSIANSQGYFELGSQQQLLGRPFGPFLRLSFRLLLRSAGEAHEAPGRLRDGILLRSGPGRAGKGFEPQDTNKHIRCVFVA